MAVTIRLMRFGKPKTPFYRIVVLDKRKKRDGAYIEKIGQYDPLKEPREMILSKARFEYWKSVGAQLSEGMAKLLKDMKKVTFRD
ncbi:30S ribosomal protein S16 [Candidatus Woesebacteria bacterium]|nr:30S ribosomal protein S16 [Candidatus Woesebacteria bacterium]